MSFWAENRQPDLATLPGGFPVGRSVLAATAGVLSICPILCQILLYLPLKQWVVQFDNEKI